MHSGNEMAEPVSHPQAGPHAEQSSVAALVFGAIGVVFGDIGTSPLYAMKETFAGAHPLAPDEPHVLGVLSLIFWAIMLIVSVKYVAIIMRADNRGEGGSLAMLALAQPADAGHELGTPLVVVLGIFAAALFYGDSMITPAISVLSARSRAGGRGARARYLCRAADPGDPDRAVRGPEARAPRGSALSSARSCWSGSSPWRCSAS